MKSLHITNSYHPDSGGIGTFYRALMSEAPRHEVSMRLVVPSDTSRSEQVNAWATIHHIAAKPSPVGDARYRLLWPWGRTGRALRDILRAEQPDLVEIGDKYTLPFVAAMLKLGCIRGVPRPALVAISHERMDDNIRSYFRLGALGTLLSRVYMNRLYFPIFDVHVANSSYTAGEFPRAIPVLPMGVDAVAFHPRDRTPEARSRLAGRIGRPESLRMVLYAGRLSREKNIPLLVELMAELGPGYTLVVAGDGELRPTLERAGAAVLGHLRSRSELAAVYAGADVFVHPNPREPFGIAPLEAMAAGVPVVAPNRGGLLTYANEANAWLADATAGAFAAAVRAVTTAKQAEARRTAERHHWPEVAAGYFRLFRSVCPKRYAAAGTLAASRKVSR